MTQSRSTLEQARRVRRAEGSRVFRFWDAVAMGWGRDMVGWERKVEDGERGEVDPV